LKKVAFMVSTITGLLLVGVVLTALSVATVSSAMAH
jgi:hypothetical protein